jgi:hypothetical protein
MTLAFNPRWVGEKNKVLFLVSTFYFTSENPFSRVFGPAEIDRGFFEVAS